MNTYTGIGRLIQINVNLRGGVPGFPVSSASVTRQGIAGDVERDREAHGGPVRAVSLYALERIESPRPSTDNARIDDKHGLQIPGKE